MRKYTIAAVAMILAACSKDIQNSDAVKQGVVEYLQERKSQTGLDMSLMQVDVVSVAFEKDKAHATVMFRPKSGADAAGMSIAYTLERKGNKWVVQPGNTGGASPHGGAGESSMPPGHPPMPGGGAQSPMPGGSAAPPAGGSLPPGHPPVGAKQ